MVLVHYSFHTLHRIRSVLHPSSSFITPTPTTPPVISDVCEPALLDQSFFQFFNPHGHMAQVNCRLTDGRVSNTGHDIHYYTLFGNCCSGAKTVCLRQLGWERGAVQLYKCSINSSVGTGFQSPHQEQVCYCTCSCSWLVLRRWSCSSTLSFFLRWMRFPPAKPSKPPPTAAATPATLNPASNPSGPAKTVPTTAPATGNTARLERAAYTHKDRVLLVCGL